MKLREAVTDPLLGQSVRTPSNSFRGGSTTNNSTIPSLPTNSTIPSPGTSPATPTEGNEGDTVNTNTNKNTTNNNNANASQTTTNNNNNVLQTPEPPNNNTTNQNTNNNTGTNNSESSQESWRTPLREEPDAVSNSMQNAQRMADQSNSESADTHLINNKSPANPHGDIPSTIRSGENKFHGLPIGQVDPNDCLHPGHLKIVNTIVEKIKENKVTKRTPLSSKVVWKGEPSMFKICKRVVMGHFRQIRAGHLFNPKFQRLFETHGDNAVDHWCDQNITKDQFLSNKETLCGALEGSIQGNYRDNELMKHQNDQDGLKVWLELLDICNRGGNKEIQLEELEKTISTPFHQNCKGGLKAFLTDCETAFTELVFVLEETAWKDEATQK